MTYLNIPRRAGDYINVPATLAPAGTTQTVDWAGGSLQILDLGSASGNVTVTLSNPEAGATYVLKVIQSGTARSITWPASVLWESGSAPTLSAAEDAVDVVVLTYDGTNYLCSYLLNLS